MSGKEDTFVFKPEEEHNKPQLERNQFDEYSSARRSQSLNSAGLKEEKDNKGLVIIAVILAVLLVAAVVAGIFILKPERETPPEPEIIVEEDENEEEVIPEKEKEIIVSCSVIFYADSIVSKNGNYLLRADLYDNDFYRFDSRKLTIDEDTDIRESGKRISPEALIYLIEEAGGDSIVFDAKIDENKNVVRYLYFAREEVEEEEETEEPTENKDPSSTENEEGNTPPENEEITEDTTENQENVVTENTEPTTEQTE